MPGSLGLLQYYYYLVVGKAIWLSVKRDL
ncbi:hypothetical protein S96127_3617 [Yersinia pestis]|nr:hypothetical protein S96127_3617 [Yersinia pestis]